MKISRYLFLLPILAITACTEDYSDANQNSDEVAYVNFYNAIEASRFDQNLQLGVDNMIYINDSVPSAIFPKYPRFSQTVTDDGRQFPAHFTGSETVIDNGGGVPIGVNYRKVYWMPIARGSYDFIYTSKDKVYLERKSSVLESKSYYAQYVVESPAADSLYTVVETNVPREGKKGVVRVQVVNLSPDLGPVNIYRTDNNNVTLPSDLPQGYTFGQTGVYDLSTEGTENTFDKIFIKFQRPGDASPIQSVAVPADSGAVYTIVLQGFTQQAQRKIKIANDAYATVTVVPDLRVNVRRMFF